MLTTPERLCWWLVSDTCMCEGHMVVVSAHSTGDAFGCFHSFLLLVHRISLYTLVVFGRGIRLGSGDASLAGSRRSLPLSSGRSSIVALLLRSRAAPLSGLLVTGWARCTSGPASAPSCRSRSARKHNTIRTQAPTSNKGGGGGGSIPIPPPPLLPPASCLLPRDFTTEPNRHQSGDKEIRSVVCEALLTTHRYQAQPDGGGVSPISRVSGGFVTLEPTTS